MIKDRSNRVSRPYLPPLLLLVAMLSLATMASAQGTERGGAGLEFAGGWSHVTGNFGLDGFDVTAGWWFTPRASVIFNYGDVYDNSPLTAFRLSSLGSATVKSRLQNFLVGPRVAFPRQARANGKAIPFAEALFGGTHLRTTISQALPGQERDSTDSAFTWGLGGGLDYALTSHWTARINLDLLRTHLGDSAQSRLRLALGGAYTFGAR